jgi:hypothetical protein
MAWLPLGRLITRYARFESRVALRHRSYPVSSAVPEVDPY